MSKFVIPSLPRAERGLSRDLLTRASQTQPYRHVCQPPAPCQSTARRRRATRTPDARRVERDWHRPGLGATGRCASRQLIQLLPANHRRRPEAGESAKPARHATGDRQSTGRCDGASDRDRRQQRRRRPSKRPHQRRRVVINMHPVNHRSRHPDALSGLSGVGWFTGAGKACQPLKPQ